MPEACFLCLDSTEYMRNGDQFPNRLMAEENAANMLVNAKVQMNAENTVGFLTTGGSACTVHETLTSDADRVMSSLSNITIGGKVCHFTAGLLIASLALSHRTNPRSEKRIVAFVGTPLVEDEAQLEVLAKRLRKNDVAVDVVSFGVEENVALLENFVSKVSKNNNSHFLSVSDTDNLTSALMSDVIFLGENAPLDGGNHNGADDFSAFGADPNMDPDLAMALRLSYEEEMQRQAAAAAAAASNTNASNAPTANPPAPPAETTAPPTSTPVVNEEEMDEDEMLRLAIAMSLNDQQANTTTNNTVPQESNVENEEEDNDFMKEAKGAIEKDQKEDGRLTKIGDVNPKDIHTDLKKRTLTLENFLFRKETVNGLLPFHIESGSIPLLSVEIPNPMTADPLYVKAKDGCVELPLDDVFPSNTEFTKEEALRNITDYNILGEKLCKDASTDEDEHLETQTNDDVESLPSESSSRFEEFLSCASDSEASESGESPLNSPKESGGLFSSLFSRVSSSVSWIWNRTIEIHFENIALNLPADFRQDIYFSIKVSSFRVRIQPKEKMNDEEELQVTTLLFEGAKVEACAKETTSKVVSVDSVEVKITSVYKSGVLVRKNTSVNFGEVKILADEGSLYALVKCHLTREFMLCLPSYCRPFATLRREKSLWHYACCCVLTMIQDKKKRFNPNLSHLRFYAEARRRYIGLLEAAHRQKSVELYKEELAETELELRYPDVILFLRLHVQEKFGATPSKEAVVAVEEIALRDPVHTSLHFAVSKVSIDLPASSKVVFSEMSFVSRNADQRASLGKVELWKGERVQCLSDSTPLLAMETTTSDKGSTTQVALSPTNIRLKFKYLMSTFNPILDLVRSMNITLPAKTSTIPSTALPESERLHTVIVAIPHFFLYLDDFSLCLESASFTKAALISGEPVSYGCVVTRFSIEWRKTFLLLPVEVRMDSSKDIIVSELHVEVNKEMWDVGKGLVAELNEAFDGLVNSPAMVATTLDSKTVSYERLSKWVSCGLTKTRKKSPCVIFKGVHCFFEPLQATIRVAGVTASLFPGEHLQGRRVDLKVSVESIKVGITRSDRSTNSTTTLTATVHDVTVVRCSASLRPAVLVLHTVEVLARLQSSSLPQPLQMACVRQITGVVRESFTLLNLESVALFNDGVSLSNCCVLAESFSSVPSPEHPYLASAFQISTSVNHIQTQSLVSIPFHVLTSFGIPLIAFLKDELIPEKAFRLFLVDSVMAVWPSFQALFD